MVNKILTKGKRLFTGQQSTILSAATIIMVMIVASRVLGLIRQRTLATFFAPGEISLFFAAFRLPDTIFEVLVFGTFSSAFIPVFTKAVDKDKRSAWRLASTISNIGISAFLFFAILLCLFANNLYGVIAPGFSLSERDQIVQLTKILFAAQGFFVLSYVLTGVLESLRRFLVPALAPLFYNLGIILGTVLLSDKFGLVAPAIGVFAGAMMHFLIQLPLAVRLGYKITTSFRLDSNVRKIGKLAAPRVLELTFSQVAKSVELYLSSFISTASYAYFYLGNTLQLLPVGLFGTSIAKAALPTLAKQSDDRQAFRKSLFNSLYQVVFLVLPVSAILIVLRIPIVRLVYGTEIFDWESTVQTGWVVSAFAVGVVFQSTNSLLARAFYALHNTKTPVVISIISMGINIIFGFFLVRTLGLPVWGLALAFSIGAFLQSTLLFVLLNRKISEKISFSLITPVVKASVAAVGSGGVMYVILKVFDRSVWVKRLSFITNIEAVKNLPFEMFVLDTRFTINLLILTVVVSIIGGLTYLAISILLKSNEVYVFFNLVKRTFIKHKVSPIPSEEEESVVPVAQETAE
jgi:putative peptidoglycan lipid II flippase